MGAPGEVRAAAMAGTPAVQVAVADTPFQIISIICYMAAHPRADEVTDLLLLEHHRGIGQHLAGIRGTGLFRRVELLHDAYEVRFHLSYQMLVNCVVQRGRALERLRACGCTLGPVSYDRLIIGCPNLLVHDVAIALLKPGFETVAVDDGTGSHTGIIFSRIACLDPLIDASCPDFSWGVRAREAAKRVINLFTGGCMKLGIRELWMFSPGPAERRRYRAALAIHELVLDGRGRSLLEGAFQLDGAGAYEGARAVYLAQPPDVRPALAEAEAAAFAVISRICPDVVVRPHPRGLSAAVSDWEGTLDESGASWEALLAAGLVDDRTVLIGFASSAQANPKLLFGMEPPLVLLQRLIEGDDLLKEAEERTALDILGRYRHKERVFIPASLGELSHVLSSGEVFA